jgi:predicted histone-like DNA-binding protein
MAIKFKINKNSNTIKPPDGNQYYAKAISNGEISSEQLLKILAKKTKLNYVDCLRFMMYLEETMKEELKNGKIVRLGDIGSFQIGITSKVVDTEAKVTAKTMGNAKVNFRACKDFKKMLQELEYTKVKD